MVVMEGCFELISFDYFYFRFESYENKKKEEERKKSFSFEAVWQMAEVMDLSLRLMIIYESHFISLNHENHFCFCLHKFVKNDKFQFKCKFLL